MASSANARLPFSPLGIAISFVDCINRGDVDGLSELMHEGHELKVFDEPATVGRENNRPGWHGYATSFPGYIIHPHRMAVRGDTAAILGHTTGSHLGLPDEEESKLTLIWLSELADGKVRRWTLVEDTPENRRNWGLD